MRYSRGTDSASQSPPLSRCTVPAFLCHHIWKNRVKERPCGKVRPSPVQSRVGREEGENNVDMSSYSSVSPPSKLLVLVLKALTFLGHMLVCLRDFSFQREAFCFFCFLFLNAKKTWLFWIRFFHAIFTFTDVFSSKTVVYWILGRIYMYIYIFQEIFTLNSDTVNLWPFNSSILLLPLTRNPAFSLCI